MDIIGKDPGELADKHKSLFKKKWCLERNSHKKQDIDTEPIQKKKKNIYKSIKITRHSLCSVFI